MAGAPESVLSLCCCVAIPKSFQSLYDTSSTDNDLKEKQFPTLCWFVDLDLISVSLESLKVKLEVFHL